MIWTQVTWYKMEQLSCTTVQHVINQTTYEGTPGSCLHRLVRPLVAGWMGQKKWRKKQHEQPKQLNNQNQPQPAPHPVWKVQAGLNNWAVSAIKPQNQVTMKKHIVFHLTSCPKKIHSQKKHQMIHESMVVSEPPGILVHAMSHYQNHLIVMVLPPIFPRVSLR